VLGASLTELLGRGFEASGRPVVRKDSDRERLEALLARANV
jgi:hypothetical protein